MAYLNLAVDVENMSSMRRRAAGPFSVDRTRERTAVLNQLTLGGVLLVLATIVLGAPFDGSIELFYAGLLIVFLATGATMVLPWNRIGPGWLAIVPTIDIVAVTFLRTSSPSAGFGLLWIFPTMWLAAGFGLMGMFGVIMAILVIFVITLLLNPQPEPTYATVLLPLVVFAVAVTSYVTARRSNAQRVLLAKQAALLGIVLERTRTQEQEVTEVLDAVDFGVIRIGADGRIAVTNDAHGRLQRAIERPDAEAAAYRDDASTPLPPDELPLQRALRGEAFDGQLVWFGEPNEDRRAWSSTARRLTDTAGEDVGAVLVSRDVTREMTALRARDEIVASVSHELRTPLTSILGYLDLVIDDPSVPGPARDNLKIAERNAERLLTIVGDILQQSSSPRSEGPEVALAAEDVDVADLVRLSAESLLPRARERAVTIDVSDAQPATAHADPLRLRQVIDNLIANAIAYNREGGRVSVGTTTDGIATWLLVTDTGVGISRDDQEKLFQRYYRAPQARATAASGTGLGLAISRDLVRAHGGDITVRSTSGVGSTFMVRLPAAHAPAAQAPAPEGGAA